MTSSTNVPTCGCGLIDTHTHFVPSSLPEYTGARSSVRWPSLAPAQSCHQHLMLEGKIYRTVSNQCWDPVVRAADMERTGVDRQVLSPMPELLSYWLHPDDGASLCRFLNESLAEFVSGQPNRFSVLGAVPLQDVDAAIRELDHAVNVLGMAGVEIGTNVNGVVIGDPRLDAFFAAAEQYDAAIFVHALRPSGMDRLVGPAFLEQVLAFPGEVGLAAASTLSGGMLIRHPNLRIAFSHGGGTLRALLPRLMYAWNTFAVLRDQIPESPLDLARRMYYDDLVYDEGAILHLVQLFGPTQIMAGTDYPFAIMDGDPAGRLQAVKLDNTTRQLLRGANALRWLGMNGTK